MGYSNNRGFSLNIVLVIIAVNLLMFIATLAWGKGILTVQGSTIVLYKAHYYLGLMPAALVLRPWTIITNLFIHGSFWHLFANMLTFYFFGTYLSKLAGRSRFLLVYFGGGILGNIFYMFLGEPISIAIGASGAVFALAGALVMVVPQLKVLIFPIPAPVPLWVAVIGVFIVLTVLSGLLNIAWEAHLGGLLAGLVAGYFLKKGRFFYYVR
jgi:membrane associated rhomboid family serine protease